MSNTSHSVTRNVITFLISGVIVASALWVIFNRQHVLDTATNWTYEPTVSITTIVERTDLTDKGKFMFYATKPEVLERDAFNNECPRQEAGSPILGCYTANDRIYMYNVTDEKLDGMKEVTAAHEILHAVWYRSSNEEQERLGTLLKEAYQRIDDDALTARMDYYERTEPGEFVNELHSILGTETANLGDELETYFGQFYNREKVLALHNNYSQRYYQLSQRADTLFAEMEKLSKSIDDSSKEYNAALTAYSEDVETFNSRANAGGFESNSQFYTERAALTQRSNQLESDRQVINALIATYNTYYEEYQKIGEQLELLNDSMDSYRTIKEAPAV